jgi:hypothetical protein
LTFSGPRAREGKLIFLQETGNHLAPAGHFLSLSVA